MATVRAPFAYFGGKQLMVPMLLDLLPPHDVYVEPFGGAGTLLFSKRPAKVTVYNDLDSGVVNFFRVLRDPKRAKRLIDLLELTPYAREEYITCRETWQKTRDSVEKARRWYVSLCMSVSKHCSQAHGWSYSRIASTSRKPQVFRNAVSRLPEFTALLRDTHIEHSPALQVIKLFDTSKTLFYLDPPYLPSTRKSGGYAHEMTEQQHEDLLNALPGLEGMVMISGYPSPLYDDALSGWRCMHYQTIRYSANYHRSRAERGREARTECLWLSPNCTAHQQQLF